MNHGSIWAVKRRARRWAADHITPVSKGEPTWFENVCLACHPCNESTRRSCTSRSPPTSSSRPAADTPPCAGPKPRLSINPISIINGNIAETQPRLHSVARRGSSIAPAHAGGSARAAAQAAPASAARPARGGRAKLEPSRQSRLHGGKPSLCPIWRRQNLSPRWSTRANPRSSCRPGTR
ncbi:HNH endonuclease [Sorangium sp. So ce296]|uniref:HNH endonuclease n=1 Tax=Sorangium sp. So ce296 TaxID=3133296 RepID=UPI003F5DA5C0